MVENMGYGQGERLKDIVEKEAKEQHQEPAATKEDEEAKEQQQRPAATKEQQQDDMM